MPANGTKTTQAKGQTAPTQTKRTGSAQVREGISKARNGATTYVRQGTERAVDVPVGAALVAADRVNAIVEPWTDTEAREQELKSIRQRVERELNKFERRGGTARRRASQRVRKTRNRVERELKQRRQRVETSVKENRTKAEEQLKKARTTVEERVSTLV
jgi:Skp family chaperone for outer membrane proteins